MHGSGAFVCEDDTELMSRAARGEEACFQILVERHRKPLIRFLLRMIRSAAIAEELAQETFLQVYRARQEYVPAARFSTWLYRIATNRCLNWIRDHRHEVSAVALDSPEAAGLRMDITPVDRKLVAEERARALRRAILALSDRQREAVVMRVYREFDYARAADALDCSVSAYKSLLSRAQSSLRTRMVAF